MTITRINVMHVSLQFSDRTAQKRHDAEVIFKRARSRDALWVTGTEAQEADSRGFLDQYAGQTGYSFYVHGNCWIGLRKTEVRNVRHDYNHVLDAGAGQGRHGDVGITSAEFDTDLGQISVGVSHLLLQGYKPSDPNYRLNGKVLTAIGEWGKAAGQGRRLAFFAGDMNTPDRTEDVFRGKPFTTLADEMRDWQNTGHGSIDCIASYDLDRRVKGAYWRVLDDREFYLFTDHFACEGGFDIGTK